MTKRVYFELWLFDIVSDFGFRASYFDISIISMNSLKI